MKEYENALGYVYDGESYCKDCFQKFCRKNHFDITELLENGASPITIQHRIDGDMKDIICEVCHKKILI